MNSYQDPLAAVYHLVHTIGPRAATSLAEAQAAAYVDGRLRHAGLSVSADSFQAPQNNGIGLLLITVLAAVAALLSGWFPLLSCILACGLLLLTFIDEGIVPMPALAPHATSQNIVGIAPCEQHIPHWRVILLAALDTPTDARRGQWAYGGRTSIIIRWVALALVAILAMLRWYDGAVWWWYAQGIPVVMLALLLLPAKPAGEASAGGAGALAVMLAAAECLQSLQQVELWAIAPGATSTGDNGIRDLLRRYPFTQADTLILSLENIVPGDLRWATREGIYGQYAADDLLVQLATQGQTATPEIAADIRPSNAANSLAMPLHRRGFRAISLHTQARFTLEEGEDILELCNPQTMHQAVQLLVDMIKHLDNETSKTRKRKE